MTIADCKNILKDVFSQIRVITVDKIQNVVSNYFNISLSKMLSQEDPGRLLDQDKSQCT